MKKTRIIIISLIIILCIASVAIAIIFQMTENDYKKAANKEQSTQKLAQHYNIIAIMPKIRKTNVIKYADRISNIMIEL